MYISMNDVKFIKTVYTINYEPHQLSEQRPNFQALKCNCPRKNDEE